MSQNRRNFIKSIGIASLSYGSLASGLAACATAGKTSKGNDLFFDISLAEWSLHKALFAKKITNLDFPGIARKEFDIGIVEYVNQFFQG